ncbi:MAG TPA: HEAT repeat domain-containing protein [Polyangiaceae bacterium]|nr:HEAT repeat domain-containing protein [Polyangiaceae bacterium]
MTGAAARCFTPFALAVGLLATAAEAAPAELQLPANPEQRALAVALDDSGLWYAACAAAPCSARAGQRLELPADARAQIASAALEVLALGPRERAVHVRIPISADTAWEALLVAAPDASPPRVPFAGVTGLSAGEEGERSGDVVWVRSDDKGQRVLVGRAREDVQLCGRPTLLEPRRLDEQGRLRPVQVQQLSLAERRAARVLEARPSGAPTPGGNPLRALAASSAIGDPGALTDGRDETAWAEARGGDGRGEFVLMRPLSGVRLVALELLLRPSGEVAAGAAAPRSLWLATRGELYRVDWREDAFRAPGLWYRVELPAPLQVDCLGLVLEQAFSERADARVTLAEVRGVGELANLDSAALVGRLATPGEPGEAAAVALLALGNAGVLAVLQAFDALDATGRARALDVLEGAPCEVAAPAYADVLDDADAQNRRRAELRLRGCGAAADGALRSAFERGDGASGVLLARQLAAVAPALAVQLLGPRLAAAEARHRAGYREALSRAAREPSAEPALRRLLETPGLGSSAQVEVLRALAAQLPSLQPQAGVALARAVAEARGFEQRYLLLAPASRLAAIDSTAAAFIDAALADPDPHLRAGAARVAPAQPRSAARLFAALHDPEVRVRQAAAQRAGELALPGAEPGLVERVDDDVWPLVRVAAAGALGGLGPSRTADDALIRALGDEAPDVRAAVLRALGQRGARAAVPEIAARLRDESETGRVRAAAAEALAALCDPSQLEVLTRAAHGLLAERLSLDDVTLGSAALAALGRLAPADLERRLAPFARASRPGLEQMVAAARHAERRCVASAPPAAR